MKADVDCRFFFVEKMFFTKDSKQFYNFPIFINISLKVSA